MVECVWSGHLELYSLLLTNQCSSNSSRSIWVVRVRRQNGTHPPRSLWFVLLFLPTLRVGWNLWYVSFHCSARCRECSVTSVRYGPVQSTVQSTKTISPVPAGLGLYQRYHLSVSWGGSVSGNSCQSGKRLPEWQEVARAQCAKPFQWHSMNFAPMVSVLPDLDLKLISIGSISALVGRLP